MRVAATPLWRRTPLVFCFSSPLPFLYSFSLSQTNAQQPKNGAAVAAATRDVCPHWLCHRGGSERFSRSEEREQHGAREETSSELFATGKKKRRWRGIWTTDKNNPKAFAVQSLSIESDVQITRWNDRWDVEIIRFAEETGWEYFIERTRGVERISGTACVE